MKITKLAIIGFVGFISFLGLSAIVAIFGLWIYLLSYLHHPQHKLRPHTPARTKLADNDAAYHRRLKKEPFYSGSGADRGLMLFYDAKKGSELSPNYVSDYALDEKDIKDDNLSEKESVAHRFAATDLKKDTILTFYDLKPEGEADLLPDAAEDKKPTAEKDVDENSPLEVFQARKRELEDAVNKLHQGAYLKLGVDQGQIIEESNVELRNIDPKDSKDSKSKDSKEYGRPANDLTEIVGQRAYHNLRPGQLIRFGDFTATNNAVFTNRYLPPATILKAEDLMVKEIAWDLQPPDSIPNLKFLIGKKLVHGIPKNRVVTRWDLGKP